MPLSEEAKNTACTCIVIRLLLCPAVKECHLSCSSESQGINQPRCWNTTTLLTPLTLLISWMTLILWRTSSQSKSYTNNVGPFHPWDDKALLRCFQCGYRKELWQCFAIGTIRKYGKNHQEKVSMGKAVTHTRTIFSYIYSVNNGDKNEGKERTFCSPLLISSSLSTSTTFLCESWIQGFSNLATP